MSASRVGYNIFNKYGRQSVFIEGWKVLGNRYFWEDNFMPILCAVIGHNRYQPEPYNGGEWACKRCHQWIK